MNIISTSLTKELTDSYLQYSISIFNRALPNIVDGLKTAQRRILLGLKDLDLKNDGAYKKVSRLEGHVLGLYHPNGGCAGTAINMGTCSAFRYPLTDIHGNVGGSIQIGLHTGKSIDDSPPAAPRYLEVKSTVLTDEVFLKELCAHGNEWRFNYDATTQEVVNFVPSLPTLLINGASGIATGFAANHVPYLAQEVISATIAVIKNPEITTEDLRKHILAPDFPNGARILNKNISEILENGGGALTVYGDWRIEELNYKIKSKRTCITVTALADSNSEKFMYKTLEAVETDKILGIASLNNISSRHGIEIQVVLKPNTNANEVLKQLLKYTNLKEQINVNATGLYQDQMPRKYGVKEIISIWYQERCASLKATFTHMITLNNAKIHLLDGLLIIIEDINEVIKIIQDGENIKVIKANLKDKYALDDIQVAAILDMPIKSIIQAEYNAIFKENKRLRTKNKELQKLCKDPKIMQKYIINQLHSLKDLFINNHRRCAIINEEF
jgi:DNA gyrase subunit A